MVTSKNIYNKPQQARNQSYCPLACIVKTELRLQFELSLKSQIIRGGTHTKVEDAMYISPIVGGHIIPHTQIAGLDGEIHSYGLLGRERCRLDESLELQLGGIRRLGEGHVQLSHFSARGRARVGDHRTDDALARGRRHGHIQLRVGEFGVGEAVAKGKCGLHVVRVVPAVANVHLLRVGAHELVAWVLVRSEADFVLHIGHGQGQLGGRVHLTEEHVGQCIAVLLSRHESVQDGIHTVLPGSQHGAWCDRGHHNVGTCRGQDVDQRVLSGRTELAAAIELRIERQRGAVIALIGKTGEQGDNHIGFLGEGGGHIQVGAIGGGGADIVGIALPNRLGFCEYT
jgi:hypothetical protein